MINYVTVRSAVLKPGDKIILGRIILNTITGISPNKTSMMKFFRLATTDSLTSLMNKATITRALAEEIAANLRCRR